jgi:flagellar assembly factor FliW
MNGLFLLGSWSKGACKVKVTTTRFGEINCDKSDILTFPEGILGFEAHKAFTIVDPGDNTFVMWLQSIDDGQVAFPIIEPKIFAPQHTVKLLPNELQSIQVDQVEKLRIFCILTIPQDVTKMSANLKAPIVINSEKRLGKQIVLQDNKLSVRLEIYKDLKKSLVNYSSDDSKRTFVQLVHEDEDTILVDIDLSEEFDLKKETISLERIRGQADKEI